MPNIKRRYTNITINKTDKSTTAIIPKSVPVRIKELKNLIKRTIRKSDFVDYEYVKDIAIEGGRAYSDLLMKLKYARVNPRSYKLALESCSEVE